MKARFEKLLYWVISPSRKSRVRERDPRRLWTAIVSAILAMVVWFVVSMRQNWTIEQNIQTQLVNVPDGFAPSAELPDSVRAEFSGPGWALLPVHLEPLNLSIQAPNEGGEVRLNEELAHQMPPGVNLLSLATERVQVDLDERLTKTIPIRLRSQLMTTNPEYGLRGNPTVSPDSITVSGARSILESMEYWPTEMYKNVNLGTSGITVSIPVLDSLDTIIQRNVDQVELVIPVTQFTEVVRVLPVELEDSVPGENEYRFQPNQVRVRFQVPIDQYERAGQAYFKVIARRESIRQDYGTGVIRLDIDRSQDLIISNLRLEPNRVEFYVIAE